MKQIHNFTTTSARYVAWEIESGGYFWAVNYISDIHYHIFFIYHISKIGYHNNDRRQPFIDPAGRIHDIMTPPRLEWEQFLDHPEPYFLEMLL